MVTQLIIGCRRKVVIYSWKDGEAQEIKVCMTVYRFELFDYHRDLILFIGGLAAPFSPPNCLPGS